MAPSWSARLPFGSSSNSNKTSASSKTDEANEKALPRLPVRTTDVVSSLERPRTSHGTPSSSHSRSASQPSSKLFGRKKSSGNLNQGQKSGDIPFDESLIPVLDDSPVDSVPSSSFRGLGSRKKSHNETQDTRVQRRCICCDSRVKVPKELEKFRCTCCLTINDIKPLAVQREEYEQKVQREKGLPPDEANSPPPRPQPTLSVERTRAIIQRCLFVYLDSRSRTSGQLAPSHALQKIGNRPHLAAQVPPTAMMSDSTLTQSPPVTPSLEADGQFPALSPARTNESLTAMNPPRSQTLPLRAPIRNSSAPDAAKHSSIMRKPVPTQPTRRPPPLPINLKQESPAKTLRHMPISSVEGEMSPRFPTSPRFNTDMSEERRRYERVKMIFKPLDDYIIASFGNMTTLNTSFSTLRPLPAGRARSESHIPTPPSEPIAMDPSSMPSGLDELDAKTLLLGDIGENGSWWTGKLNRQHDDYHTQRKKLGSDRRKPISSRSPNITWSQVAAWYALIHTAGQDWQRQLESSRETNLRPLPSIDSEQEVAEIEDDLAEARSHTIRVLMKATENLLKRPGKILREPEDLRWLLIALANPSLYPAASYMARIPQGQSAMVRTPVMTQDVAHSSGSPRQTLSPVKQATRDVAQHSGILKRIFGLLAHSPDSAHRYIVNWTCRFYEEHFTSLVDLCSSFITYRLSRPAKQARTTNNFVDGGLIPDFTGGAMQTSAQLHSAMGLSGSNKKRAEEPDGETDWAMDWQIKGAAKFMSLLFAANNNWQGRRKDYSLPRKDSGMSHPIHDPTPEARRNASQLLATSTFYNTLLDYQDLITDFKVWENHKDKFAFCQYPLFLSMGAKIKIMEHDARRQMEIKAREAYFDQVIRQRAIDGHYHLRIRRDCMVEDSLRQISEAVGSGQEELKKGLRVHFAGEEGVDAGGPRKEWFLMLVREVFDADHGLFVYDDDSHTCYFNPNTFETSDQYYLVGAVLGLAIYNSTILDIALPSFAFRKLLAAAPPTAGSLSFTTSRNPMTYSLTDLAEYKPKLAAGLQQLLDFDGDVESTYCWSFVAPVERYGVVNDVPLISNGENTAVTNANKQEFVDAYVKYLLDTAVSRQFEPFKRGFFTVCAGNALSLFRAEEIELLIRGSDGALDIDSLQGVAAYENWRHATEPHSTIKSPNDSEPVIEWFWQAFAFALPEQQRKLLTFITGSDRIPAVGATSLVLKVVAGGDGWSGVDTRGNKECQRYPVARTCFNMLVLWRYESREQLEQRLWRAVEDSEGFGLK